MYKFSEMLDRYIESEIKKIVKIRILNKYRNVFHCDDPICNEKYDETYLGTGELNDLSYRIKTDYSKFESEEFGKIREKIEKLIAKFFQEVKE